MRDLATRHAGADAVELTEDPGSGPKRFAGNALAIDVLWTQRWQHRALVELGERLGPQRLLFLEPSIDVGARGLGQRATARLTLRRHGIRYDRDVPARLRHAGFMITHLDRFSVPGRRWATYAYGEATLKTR